MDIKFLNVDLELKSQQDISLIINELGDNVLILHQENKQDYYSVRLELAQDAKNPDITINCFCDLIKNLSEDTRKVWNNCEVKVFDIGYESGIKPNYFISKIQPDTIQRVANLGASINITIYPIYDEHSSLNL